MASAPADPPAGVVRHYNFLPLGESLLGDVLHGLALPQKSLPPKYFYDARGAALFELICELPEYYPTRTEAALMQARIDEMAAFLGTDCEMIEYGSGAGIKTRLLLERLRPRIYVPIDISCLQLKNYAQQLGKDYPWLNVSAICGDYSRKLVLPEWVGLKARRKVAFFPGSTIGNFTLDEAFEFLRSVRATLGKGGAMLVGVDLKKDPQRLHAAYNDAQGVTAQFNLNLLARINRELGADFDLRGFEHHAIYDAQQGRIEMHLRALRDQTVSIREARLDFAAGETILTEISAKYSASEFRELARNAGFNPAELWIDDADLFSIHGLLAS